MEGVCRSFVVTSLMLLVLYKTSLSVNFLNTEFENVHFRGNWHCNHCRLTANKHAYTGNHSGHVFHRVLNSSGIYQNVNLTGDTLYKIMFYVRTLSNLNNTMYQDVEVVVACKDQHGKAISTSFGITPHVKRGPWYAVGGVNKLPTGAHGCRVLLQVEAPTPYLVDHALLQEVTTDKNWKTAANQNIDSLRKANVTIRLAGTHDSTTKLSIELIQQKQEFAFGSSLRVATFNYDTYKAYQKVFLDTFEWAVFENSLRWQVCQPRQDVQWYDINIKVLDILRQHGIRVRGHTVFESDESYIQDWVKAMNKTELLTEIDGRIQRVLNHTKGKIEHWNVNNEDINNDFYAQRTENPDITMSMFKKVHAIDSHPKLFLNEHSILSKCDKAVALMDKARHFKNSRVPIGGIGVEGNLHEFDVAEIWERLNILGEAGLPVVISELAIHEKNETIKAQKLEDLLTLFFSHPAVEGVIFWGFWQDRYWETDADLFEGYGVTPNAAGRRLQDLLLKKWRTNEVGSVIGSQPWHTRAFKGDYRLDVKHNGELIRTENITLTGNGQIFDLNIDGVQNGHPHVSGILVG